MDRYDSPRIPAPYFEGQPDPYRVDLELRGVDHSGESYEGRVYIDNKKADASTGRDPGAGYAGSFYVFGHGPCIGADEHCEVEAGPPIHPFDYRRPHPLTGQTMRLEITDALRARNKKAGAKFTVTIVPLVNTPDDPYAQADVLQFDRLSVIAYDAAASE